MALIDDFENARQKIKGLLERPGNAELLDLYALFKQATDGDNNTGEPGMFDLKAKFKWKQWDSKRGMSKEDAMHNKYFELVESLYSKYKHN